ncbi:MAG: bifunctional homocysteine S-methyltransferase/methylenetetrahydrofolate reductase [Planctomycetia bacterium]
MFTQAIRSQVLVFDGAMGTELYKRHVFTNRCYDELSLVESNLIRGIHTSYTNAGADVLTTNSFAANRVALMKYGLADQAAEINRAAARLAREVADETERTIYVAGDIGPLPAQPQYEDQVESMILDQVGWLMEGGADFILFETIRSRKAIEQIALAMRGAPDVPYVISFAMLDTGETLAGEPLSHMLAPLPEGTPQPTAWGLNCGTGPNGMLGIVEQAIRMTDLPLIIQPNAGIPKEVEHRTIYFSSPEYVATYARRYVNLGVAAVGGCCGIGPDHIREIVSVVKMAVIQQGKGPAVMAVEDKAEPQEPSPLAERSNFGKLLAEGAWIKTVELLPPRGYDLTNLIEKSRTLAEQGVSAVNVPDGPRASSRISPLIACERIRQEAGIEPILHFCCRDRNLIGMQSDLLASAACDVKNILFITGDPPKLGNYPNATGVFDTDSIGMVAVQDRLNRGVDLGGQALDPKTNAVIGVGLDPTALDRERELERFHLKVDAGAEFAITQPVFDPEALFWFLDRIDESHRIPIIAGIWPLASYRNATFMNNEVPGVKIPDSIMKRMEAEETREGQLATGIQIAREAVETVRDRVSGIQVSAPFGRIETALAVME